MGKKLTLDYVRNFINQYNHELISETYKNNREKISIKCDKGHIYNICFDSFKKGHRCSECGNKLKGQYQKYTYDEVYKYFKKNDCLLLDKKYIDNKTNMQYICSCGNKHTITFSSFLQGARCDICKIEKIKSKLKLSYGYVYDYFKNNQCELLEDYYKNNNIEMKFKCSCGNIDYTTFMLFRLVPKCSNCCDNKSKGEKRIKNFLDKENIFYIREYKFEDLINIRPLKFDFAIFNEDSSIKYLIEFDGIQHYMHREHLQTYEDFLSLLKHDKMKNEYCELKKINLLRIPYWEINNIENILKEYLSL